VKELSEKWFGPIEAGEPYVRSLPQEPAQNASRSLEVFAKVPLDSMYKCWHIFSRTDPRYYATDLITEVLGGGGSSRLYQALVKEQKLFSNIDCYHHGTVDPGLLTIEGKLVKGVTMQEAEAGINAELEKLKAEVIAEAELQKVKNKTESMIAFEDMSVMNRANSLAFYELLGNAGLMNTELDRYQQVTAQEIHELANSIFQESNCSTLYYNSKQ
jgi:zinc protease